MDYRLVIGVIAATGIGCDNKQTHRVLGGPVSIQTEEPLVKVIHYTSNRVDNPNPRGETSRIEFDKVRQDVIATCRRFGMTGPDKGPDGWPTNPAYFVIDDQYNSELYQYVEVLDRKAMSAEWIKSAMQTLARHPGWGICIKNIKNGYLIIFADRLMITGPVFEECNDATSVATTVSKHLGGIRGEHD
jgi:hypothetical protein